MCLRERPRMFGASFIGQKTFVARTISSRLPIERSARPVTSSLMPSEDMDAVPKKLIPCSMAERKNGCAACSSSTHGRHIGLPYDMQPRQMRETVSLVPPRVVYCIARAVRRLEMVAAEKSIPFGAGLV